MISIIKGTDIKFNVAANFAGNYNTEVLEYRNMARAGHRYILMFER